MLVRSGKEGQVSNCSWWRETTAALQQIRIIHYIGGNHFQVSFTFFRLFVIVTLCVCWIKTDDHEKITDKSPVSDSLKIHLLNHEVRLRKFHLIHSLHHRTFCKLFSVQPSPAQPSSESSYVSPTFLPLEILIASTCCHNTGPGTGCL